MAEEYKNNDKQDEGAPERGRRGEGGGRGRGGGKFGGREGGRRGGSRRSFRGKVSEFTIENANYIDYKDIDRLRNFMAPSGKILPRRMTGNSARHQRMVAQAIRRARYMALLPYVNRE
jgi:small subunit ribosomal protein S18